jgi:hypothetical protein
VRRAVVLLVLVAAGLAGGYALGHLGGADVSGARSAGEHAGAIAGANDGRREAREAGHRAGYRATYRPAYRAAFASARGEVVSHARAQADVVANSSTGPSGQPSSCSAGLVSAANGCVAESQAVCAAYEDFVPGQGCVPPLQPGQVEATPDCPGEQVPVGLSGACARPY